MTDANVPVATQPKSYQELQNDARIRADAHQLAAGRDLFWNGVFGGAAAILAAVGGTSAFVSLSQSQDPRWVVAAGVFGILAAAVGAINTFFRKGENAGLHRATAAVAAELGRSIEWAIEHPVDAASEEARFNRFSDAITRIDQSPRVPDDIWDKVKNRSGSP